MRRTIFLQCDLTSGTETAFCDRFVAECGVREEAALGGLQELQRDVPIVDWIEPGSRDEALEMCDQFLEFVVTLAANPQKRALPTELRIATEVPPGIDVVPGQRFWFAALRTAHDPGLC